MHTALRRKGWCCRDFGGKTFRLTPPGGSVFWVMDPVWTVYLLLCRGNRLYTGICKDLERRMEQHASGRGAKFTRAHPPERLVAKHTGLTLSQALRLEIAIKALPRSAKISAVRAGLATLPTEHVEPAGEQTIMRPYSSNTNAGRTKAGDDIHHKTADQPAAARRLSAIAQRKSARREGRQVALASAAEIERPRARG